jgi:hypothetical protein
MTFWAVPVKHSAPTVGYQITYPDGESLFYTGDTTVGLSDCWQHISPQLLITEVAGPDKYEDWLKKAGHLYPRLLEEELIQFRRLKGYLPRIIGIHIGNPYEQEIKEEVAQVAQELNADKPGLRRHEDYPVATPQSHRYSLLLASIYRLCSKAGTITICAMAPALPYQATLGSSSWAFLTSSSG